MFSPKFVESWFLQRSLQIYNDNRIIINRLIFLLQWNRYKGRRQGTRADYRDQRKGKRLIG